MLKTTVSNTDMVIRDILVNQDFTADRDFYNAKLLGLGKSNVVNSIVDSEIYEFKPHKTNAINFNLFFLRYLQDNDINEITPFMESAFSQQIYNTKVGLGIIHSSGLIADRAINNLFEIRQENNLRAPKILSDTGVNGLAVLNSRPYVSTDPIGEASLLHPAKPGLPIFYNSFTFPYWDNKSDWNTNSLLYKNKPYFYNSFLIMEVYDSPLNTIQKRLITIPVFVNSRYNFTEQNISYDFTYERPCFNLTEGCDGFSFFFLNNYTTNTFYVRFSFWDALNGVKVPLIPSSKNENNKKWFQDVNKYKQEAMYIKYVLDYTNKVYDMYEYDLTTGNYDLNRTNFDLYELAFDAYYNNVFVANAIPVDANSIPPVVSPLIPLKFNIKNIIRDLYYPPNSNNVDTLSFTLSINDSDSYLGRTASLLDTYASYVTTQSTQIVGFYNFKNNLSYNIPVNNKTITGYNGIISNFNLQNIDTINWTVTSMDFEDIIVATDKAIFQNRAHYNNLTNQNIKVAESMVLLNTNGLTIDSRFGYDFTEEIFYSVDFFQLLMDSILQNRTGNIVNAIFANYGDVFIPAVYDYVLGDDGNYTYQLINDGYYNYQVTSYFYNNFVLTPDPIRDFLDFLFTVLGLPQPAYHQANYFGFKPNDDNVLDVSDSELADYIPLIVSKFQTERANNSQIYKQIIANVQNLLNVQIDLQDIITNFVLSNAVNGINTQNINDYKLVCAYLKDGLNDRDISTINQLTLENISQAVDNNTYLYEIRDYVFQIMSVYSGTSLIKPSQTFPVKVTFNIGTKANFNFVDCQRITIKGKLKLSLLNESGEIKYIYIPINTNLYVGEIPQSVYLSNINTDNNYRLNL